MTLLSSPINDLLNKSESPLGKLIAHAQAIDELNNTFISVLDKELIPYCRVGYYDLGVLTLFANSSAWATRLRYAVPNLLSKLRSIPQWAGICSIQIKVLKNAEHEKTKTTQPESPFPPPLKMSANNAAQIQALADSLKEQPGMEKLVASLQRLLRHQG